MKIKLFLIVILITVASCAPRLVPVQVKNKAPTCSDYVELMIKKAQEGILEPEFEVEHIDPDYFLDLLECIEHTRSRLLPTSKPSQSESLPAGPVLQASHQEDQPLPFS